jgi:hypothetical protein
MRPGRSWLWHAVWRARAAPRLAGLRPCAPPPRPRVGQAVHPDAQVAGGDGRRAVTARRAGGKTRTRAAGWGTGGRGPQRARPHGTAGRRAARAAACAPGRRRARGPRWRRAFSRNAATKARLGRAEGSARRCPPGVRSRGADRPQKASPGRPRHHSPTSPACNRPACAPPVPDARPLHPTPSSSRPRRNGVDADPGVGPFAVRGGLRLLRVSGSGRGRASGRGGRARARAARLLLEGRCCISARPGLTRPRPSHASPRPAATPPPAACAPSATASTRRRSRSSSRRPRRSRRRPPLRRPRPPLRRPRLSLRRLRPPPTRRPPPRPPRRPPTRPAPAARRPRRRLSRLARCPPGASAAHGAHGAAWRVRGARAARACPPHTAPPAAHPPPPPPPLPPTPTPTPSRCQSCRKKVGLTGFKCRCGHLFCGQHRYAEDHACTFDYKSAARERLAAANPTVVADKVARF